MQAIERPWQDWRAGIPVPCAKGLLPMLEHATAIEAHLERHGPDEATVRLSLTHDVYLRSYNWGCWQLGIPLPVE